MKRTLLIINYILINTLTVHAVGFKIKQNKIKFTKNINYLKHSLDLNIKDKVVDLDIPYKKIISRTKRAISDNRVEPLSLVLNKKRKNQIVYISEKIAQPTKTTDLINYLNHRIESAKPVKSGSQNKVVIIENKNLGLIDLDSYSSIFNHKHHELTIQPDRIKRDRKYRRKFLRQVIPYIGKKKRKSLIANILAGKSIKIDTNLLPKFPKKMVKKYLVYRGPNCFHAALAFQGNKFTNSSLLNVKIEEGYHRAMINYDELWRTTQMNFYEINPKKTELKYGDMILFFDIPNKNNKNINFKWIRHATTYLFNGYTFSKGSKSANSPYAVKKLEKEWQVWKKYTKNLGMRVYRRSAFSMKKKQNINLTDWIY